MRYAVTPEDIQRIVNTTADTIFDTFAEKNISIDFEGVITARVSIPIEEETLLFNIALQDRVTVKVEPYYPFADEMDNSMGFKKNK